MKITDLKIASTLDCSWHLCPVPILMTEEKMAGMPPGEVLEVVFTDPGAKPDLMAWCRASGNEFLACRNEGTKNKAYIKKAEANLKLKT